MGHNLNFNEKEGKYSAFTVGPAWHGISTVVEQAQTSEEAIKISLLDYEVAKVPIQVVLPDGATKKFTNKFGTVRMDTGVPLGIVGNDYTILQNRDAFKFVDDLVGSKQAVFHSAGALRKGEQIFLSVKLPNELVIGKNDKIENYFCLTNSHNGSKVVEIIFSQILIVCENTMIQAFKSGTNKQRIKHTSNIHNNMFDMAMMMGIIKQKLVEQKDLFESMQKVQITDRQLRKFIEIAMAPYAEQISEEDFSKRFVTKIDKVLEYAMSAPEQLIEERKGNLWGAFNSISGYYANMEAYKSSEQRFNSLTYGTGYQRTQKALELATSAILNSNILS